MQPTLYPKILALCVKNIKPPSAAPLYYSGKERVRFYNQENESEGESESVVLCL